MLYTFSPSRIRRICISVATRPELPIPYRYTRLQDANKEHNCFIFFSSSLDSVQICLKPVPSRCILFIETLSSSGNILRPLSSFQAEVGSTFLGSSTRFIPYVADILCSPLICANRNRFIFPSVSMITHWHAFCNILFR